MNPLRRRPCATCRDLRDTARAGQMVLRAVEQQRDNAKGALLIASARHRELEASVSALADELTTVRRALDDARAELAATVRQRDGYVQQLRVWRKTNGDRARLVELVVRLQDREAERIDQQVRDSRAGAQKARWCVCEPPRPRPTVSLVKAKKALRPAASRAFGFAMTPQQAKYFGRTDTVA
jgi:hypothetical protein